MNTTLESRSSTHTTPMMAQWHACKKNAKDAILLFRLGDFYEAFYEDAHILSKELDITLTKRQDVPMSGIPQHTCEGYIDKLVQKGYRVALAEQMEDPKQTKGIVKREITRIVTPGTVVNSSLLSEKTNNFFVSVTQVASVFGLAVLDLTTSEFLVIELDKEADLLNEIYRLHPAEILTSEKFHLKHANLFADIKQSSSCLINTLEDWHFDHQICCETLISHFKVHSLDGFGLKGFIPAVNAAGSLLCYLQDQLNLSISHIRNIRTYATSHFMSLDQTTQKNLELTESQRDGSRNHTLLSVLDHTRTPMGGRLMRQWVKQPLISVEAILLRQRALKSLLADVSILDSLNEALGNVRDLERLMMKISSGFASPRDFLALKLSLETIPLIKDLLKTCQADLLRDHRENLDDLQQVTDLIGRALVLEPPSRLSDGNIFKAGYNKDLDDLRALSQGGKAWIANYQHSIREQTGIKTLKVGYTKMFGYYIEVSRGQAEKMPDSFQRRQTLVNAERYITADLKEYEEKVLTAEERICALETSLFHELRLSIIEYTDKILLMAKAIGAIDCLNALAYAAHTYQYTCPLVDNGSMLVIEEGRHPVIEVSHIGGKFIPNDTLLDSDLNRLFLITGPNMAGKSTYIRQVALLVIMAQMGSFIPAKSAHIGIIDKVFTRIGASDDLSRGQSTFMVEMTETANILNHATDRSLVILDEIGRGTSTYDGISIAWSIAEYLLTTPNKKAKTLFATHYWELTKLEERIPGAVNYNVAVKEFEDHIVFLRKIVRGDTDKSYGIHVGRLAGLPVNVINRAKEILTHLEENANRKSAFEQSHKKIPALKTKNGNGEIQFLLFEPVKKNSDKNSSKVIEDLKALNLDLLSPLQAHAKLVEIQSLIS